MKLFSLKTLIESATISIPSNIAEGADRDSNKEIFEKLEGIEKIQQG